MVYYAYEMTAIVTSTESLFRDEKSHRLDYHLTNDIAHNGFTQEFAYPANIITAVLNEELHRISVLQ